MAFTGYKRFTIDGTLADGQTLKAGNDYVCQLVIQGTGQTGAAIKFLCKQDIAHPDSSALITKTGADVTTVIGTNVLTSTWTIPGSETQNLTPGMSLLYGIQRTIDGKDVTIEEGKINIEAAVVAT